MVFVTKKVKLPAGWFQPTIGANCRTADNGEEWETQLSSRILCAYFTSLKKFGNGTNVLFL